MQTRRFVGLAIAATLLTGCGTTPEGGSETSRTMPSPSPETVTVTAPPETVTVTAQPETESPAAESESPEESTSSGIALPPSSRALGLDDFFQPEDDWEEGRWDVADRIDLQGVSSSISEYEGQFLELRLQNQFSAMQFDAGQSNDSEASGCVTKIDVFVDGELRETREFGFNEIRTFEDIDVRDGNAVRIEASTAECVDRVRLVLTDIQLQ